MGAWSAYPTEFLSLVKPPPPGGLAVGILSSLKRTGGLWFGWGGELAEEEPGQAAISVREGVAHATINDALWPLFHYMPSKFRFRPEEQAAYEEVNRQFAQKLQPLLKPDDYVWVHDYHLIPLGA